MRQPVSRQTFFFSKGPPPCGPKAHKAVWLEITLFYGFWCFEITLLLKLPCGGRSFPQNFQDTQINYVILLLSFAIIQISACVFSVFALSIIQQLTPDNMIGKVMAYTATFSLCAQPLGQIIFGILFDGFSSAVYLILIPTGIILAIISLTTKEFFLKIENLLN